MVTRRLIAAALAALLALWSQAAMAQDAERFQLLAGLVGRWQSDPVEGRSHMVEFRLIANGTVLVETWQLSPTRVSMTTYVLADGHLTATHYCPQGTVPRLHYAGDADGRMQFRIVGGANLQSPGASHQHSFWLRLRPDGTFERAEYYVENGAAADPAAEAAEPVVTYRRIAAP